VADILEDQLQELLLQAQAALPTILVLCTSKREEIKLGHGFVFRGTPQQASSENKDR
jgi:hypothetical protein